MTLRTLALLLTLLPAAAAAAVPTVPTMPPSALHAGQKAVVRTVFAGDSVEAFEAEIVGVVPGGRAAGDVILARATSERVQHTGIAQGMSGSPVYVDGKLIGALSSGWSFSRDPLFGITPIGEMLAVLDQPESGRTDGSAGPTGVDPLRSGDARLREFAWEDSVAAPIAAAVSTQPSRLALPLVAGGLNPLLLADVSRLFSASGLTVVPGGGRAPASRTPPRLEPGDAVAVDVLRGDLNFSAIGTVTYRDGDRVLIFGHPFFHSGEVRLPLSTARITTIVSSLETSFKLGVPGTPIGTATQDRRAAVAGRLGPSPTMLPLAVDVTQAGRPTQHFRFEAIEDRALLSQLVGAAAVNSVLESGGQAVQQSLRWTLDISRGGRTLHLADATAGDSPLSDVVSAIGAPVRFLVANPFERVHLDSVRVRIETRPGRAQWTLRSATLARPSVRPGGTLVVNTEVERWRGGRETVRISVPVPEELPPGRYQLHIAGGAEFDRALAQRLPARFRPVSFEDAWIRLQSFRPSDALYAGLWARAPEVTQDGEDWSELPSSALPILVPATQSGDRARKGDWALASEGTHPMNGVLRGELLMDVNVDDQAR